ncbi:GntR family transcriptional regulator [Metabacillus litoralis]|uniref:GntR family transcriptional regulator n=1 Tax=Metabacillus litoralis TaxID=152268 RepID=UPI00203CF360|nr:GntR family transcriptional regulator [Metabacillus litoralis]MCM3410864.1 GntR family transcriptional regulator [Metabacillus litoralis]
MLKGRINKESPLPLYYQLKDIIKSSIENGYLQPEQSIPSERELSETFEISRPTVRQALNELVNDGSLIRKKGLGTFVAKPKVFQQFLETLTSFNNDMKQMGLPFTTQVVTQKQLSPLPMLENIFGSSFKGFTYIERIRLIENRPIVLVSTYVPIELAPSLKNDDLTNSSLYELLSSKYNLQIDRATRVLEAINVDENDAGSLSLEIGAAVMSIKTTGYLKSNKPFEYTIARYRGDFSSFTVNLTY